MSKPNPMGVRTEDEIYADMNPIKVPKPVKIDFNRGKFDPSEVTTEYELTTVGSYRHKRDIEYMKQWHEKHKTADVIVVNQDGQPLYAAYKSPLAHHDEMNSALFKYMRAQRLNDWEYES